MDWTGQAHFLEPFPERLPPPVKPDRDVVERRTQTGGDPIAGLAKKVGAPDDIGIFGLERRQQLMEAVADGLVGFSIRLDRQALDIGLFHFDLPAAAPDGAALVIDERGRQYPSEPSANRTDIPQLPRAFERPERKVLQELFCFVPATQPVMQES